MGPSQQATSDQLQLRDHRARGGGGSRAPALSGKRPASARCPPAPSPARGWSLLKAGSWSLRAGGSSGLWCSGVSAGAGAANYCHTVMPCPHPTAHCLHLHYCAPPAAAAAALPSCRCRPAALPLPLPLAAAACRLPLAAGRPLPLAAAAPLPRSAKRFGSKALTSHIPAPRRGAGAGGSPWSMVSSLLLLLLLLLLSCCCCC
jgi:hypothetical protein